MMLLTRSFLNAFSRIICAAGLAMVLTSCAPAKYLIGVQDPDLPTASAVGVRLHGLFIATSRRIASDPAVYFSGERAQDMTFAHVTASIPPNHEIGNIELPRGKVPDPEKDFTLVDPTLLTTERDFVRRLNQALASRPRDQREILVFIHGYNNSLSDALLRTAQFVEDTGFQGLTILFSWASRGKVLDYVYDINSALLARDDLIQLFHLLESTRANGYDLLAHSMGNLLLIEAIRQLKNEGKLSHHRKLNSVIMAAPDVDIDLFASTLAKLTPSERKFYVLVSKQDKALKYARLVAGGVDRAGDADPKRLADLGVIAIDLSKVHDSSSLHHDTFADSPEVVQLIGNQIRENEHFGVLPTDPLVSLFAETKIVVFGQ